MSATINKTSRHRRWPGSTRVVAATLVFGIGAAALGAAPAVASPPEDVVKSRMQTLVDAGYPAALAAHTDASGNVIGAAVGKGDLSTGEAPPIDGEVRIGSNNKTVVAVIIMQLVEEGKVRLDEPVETYLPGLVKGEGIDGSGITVRQLLQHTSGLPEYTDTIATSIFEIRDEYHSPRDFLDAALAKPAAFQPGEKFAYTNTNYIVLGLLIEKVTKRTLGEQIDQRIVRPLGLSHTYLPAPGDRSIHGIHAEGYDRNPASGELENITELDPSWAWAAGAMISTPSELNIFMQKMLDGTLITADSVAEMQKSIHTETHSDYGLGLIGYSLSCGTAWGHGGTIPGYQTLNAVGPDGGAVTIAVTAIPTAVAKDPTDEESIRSAFEPIKEALDNLLCGS